MLGFTNDEVVASGEFWTIWRCPTTVFMQVRGFTNDARTEEWLSALQREYDKRYPRFAAMEVSTVEPESSMAQRFKAAKQIRGWFQVIEQGALLTGARPGPLVVSRAVLRLTGMSNILLYTEVADFERHVRDFRQGFKR